MAEWKLSGEQAAEMRRLRESGTMVKDIARMYAVSEPCVRRTLARAGCGRLPASFARLKPRQQRLVSGLAAGKPIVRAAVEAGYSPNSARNAKRDLLSKPGVAPALRELLLRQVPAELMAQRLREGVDATQMHFFAHQGSVRSEREVIDFAMRAKYLELTAKLTGQLREEVEVDGQIELVVDC